MRESDKLPEIRVVRLPACKMATSGEPDMTYTKVWDFCNWWSAYDENHHHRGYAPMDFLFGENGGLVWWMMVEDDATSEECGGYDVIDFEGGLYAVQTCFDEDGDSQNVAASKIMQWIATTGFEPDDAHPNRTFMGHMINPDDEIKQGLGYHQYEVFVPIKLKK